MSADSPDRLKLKGFLLPPGSSMHLLSAFLLSKRIKPNRSPNYVYLLIFRKIQNFFSIFFLLVKREREKADRQRSYESVGNTLIGQMEIWTNLVAGF